MGDRTFQKFDRCDRRLKDFSLNNYWWFAIAFNFSKLNNKANYSCWHYLELKPTTSMNFSLLV
ncbi:hypothetical protein Q5691_08235 [Microcoleus sp. w1-18aA5]|uniref:hypothetical protein n=1 Tax=Microcoleus sp. w1-18aA5 TaxID=2818982 RepID=UPI002FCF809E